MKKQMSPLGRLAGLRIRSCILWSCCSLLIPFLAADSLAAETNVIASPAITTNDAVEKEYQKLLSDDDTAQEEIDKWIQQEQKFDQQGAGMTGLTLKARIRQRMEPVRKSYEEFLKRHPNHVNARVAFGSFLNDLGEEEPASVQWLKALELAPNNPVIWNNLGDFYGHNGKEAKCIECYEKAIELNPNQSLYYKNLAVVVYMFRTESKERYKLDDSQLKKKVMDLYKKAIALDPQNFPLAAEYAQTYYGFKPKGTNDLITNLQTEKLHYTEALEAWQNALKLANDDVERQGVYLHMARVNLAMGRRDEAKRYLTQVNDPLYTQTKTRVQKNIDEAENKAMTPPPISLRTNTTVAVTNAPAVPGDKSIQSLP